jgi:hypothetical protein
MKTTFDLPDLLVRRAKALAAQQGRPLRDLVAEAIDEKLVAEPSELSDGASESRRELWAAWKARLIEEPDGTWRNSEGIDDESFFETLDDIKAEPWTASDPFREIQPPKPR